MVTDETLGLTALNRLRVKRGCSPCLWALHAWSQHLPQQGALQAQLSLLGERAALLALSKFGNIIPLIQCVPLSEQVPLIVIRAVAVVFAYAVMSGLAAWSGAEILGRLGAFGSGHDRAMGVLLIGFPALWFAFFLLLFTIRNCPLDRFFEGWRGFTFTILVFVAGSIALWAWI